MGISIRTAGTTYPGQIYDDAPRNVYWETTIACDLACKHCRADAIAARDPEELSTEEGKALMRDVNELGSMLVLTGGDPLKRPDIFELMAYGREIGLHVAITPSTTPTLTEDVVRRFAEHGVSAMGVSIDGPDAASHDGFRQVPGTFDVSMKALEWAAKYDIPVQVNTTVTGDTMQGLERTLEVMRRHSPPIRRWCLFVLVPVGRGTQLGVPTADDIEGLFEWIYRVQPTVPFRIGTTEAPHYRRYWIQRKIAEGMPAPAVNARAKAMGFGIRDGNGVVFVSHRGDVYPAGFLPEPLLGNVRQRPLTQIYRDNPLKMLRDPDNYTGRCGRCDYKWACGGSRARAYSMTGDTMGEDPLCSYEPD